jgi:8-amino-7-oxononanoate synthase
MSQSIDEQLEQLRLRSLFRRLRRMDSAQAPVMECKGQRVVNFSSNDYLGLANDPILRNAAKRAIDAFGVGSGASRLICGTIGPHFDLENRLASFKRSEAALTFSSGYAAAVGTLGALLGRDDIVIIDKLAHASLIDGARLSGATVRVFPHNHVGKLESHLQWAEREYPEARVLVVTESVFSMDGDRAPLRDIVEIKKRYGAMLLLDEAHAVGVLGKNGRGLADAEKLTDDIDIQMGTLSKALGVSGGYICGSRKLIDLLINRARSFIYSTAPPPALAATAIEALDFLESPAGESRRQNLWLNIIQFAGALPVELRPPGKEPISAIIPVIVGETERAVAAARRLYERGFLVPAIRYPTVPRGTARLRVTISAAHEPGQIAALGEAFHELATKPGRNWDA